MSKKKKKTTDPAKKLLDEVLKPITKFFDQLLKPINSIFGYFKCGIDKIKNLYYCIAFYIIYIIISVIFTFWNIFIAPFVGLKAGNSAWKFISKYVPKQIMKCFLC
jgi:hypothetical protein